MANDVTSFEGKRKSNFPECSSMSPHAMNNGKRTKNPVIVIKMP